MITDTSTNSKRIAKNTIILYFRMMVMMFIGLFTSRIILNTLGVADYGLYNVVGGVVAMVSIISSSLSSAISRFLTFELGRKDVQRLAHTFSTSVWIQVGMAITLIIVLEIAGVWFLNTQMNIPDGRMEAANYVLQCSIITFAITLMSMPYNAMIIAHERMGIFAYITLLDAILKLVVVYLLYISPYDKLNTYASLLLLVSILIQIIYIIYCRKSFPVCKIQRVFDKKLIKEMGSYASWSLLGNGSWVINTQGINILINLFFGVTVNAARAIATQVDNSIRGFVNSFTTALNPQITKSYAAGDLEYMKKIIYAGARYSFYLMLFFAIPICAETKILLSLWLKIVPEYAVVFVRLTIIATMFEVLGQTLAVAQNATGKIKYYFLVVSIVTFLDFPLTYACFKMGMSPITAYIIAAIMYAILIFVKVNIVKRYIPLSAKGYIKEVFLYALGVTILSLGLPLLFYFLQEESVLRLISVCISSALSVLVVIYSIGINRSERQFLHTAIAKKLNRHVP